MLGEGATGEPCASMPTASTTASGPRPSVISRSWSPMSLVKSIVSTRGAPPSGGAREPARRRSPAAQVTADPAGELPHRAEPEDGQGAAGGDVGVFHSLPGGGKNIGEVKVALVRAVPARP